MKLNKLVFWRHGDSTELEQVKLERERSQQLLQDTKAQTTEIERIAAKLEAERISNHFGEALMISMTKRQRR